METSFSDIQQLWQSQKAQEMDLSTLIEGLRKTESKQRREQLFMLIITPLTIGFLFWVMPWQESTGITISLFLIALAMIGVLILSIRSKVKTLDISETSDNELYLKTQIRKLKARYIIAGKHMYVYTILLVIALNISYFILLEPLESWVRILIHTVLTAAIFGFMHWQIKRKLKKYDRELKPMIEKMEGMLEAKSAGER